MTRLEAIPVQIRRVAAAAADHKPHLAHIRHLALRRLRDAEMFDERELVDLDADGDRMFGDDHRRAS